MKIVVYTCAPVSPFSGVFRRIRIVIDGTKVTSMEPSPSSRYHHSCSHRSTVHRYLDDESMNGHLKTLRELTEEESLNSSSQLDPEDDYVSNS